ncbi:MAG TPA: nucleoside hydrolase [Terriglobales bacterium]|nr:nucleoside hydrolase [Terriglobales bacterium]
MRALIIFLGFLSAAVPTRLPAQTPSAQYPVIYSTDLYYTFIMDNDDPFDAAVLLKSPELDVKGIILDNHTYPSDGEKVLERLMACADRHVPYVKGLGEFQMRSATDQGLFAANQEGVELILKTLRESKQKVSLIAVGSLTDFSVALQRDPKLLSEKISAVYVVAGTMESRVQDWNVKLDPTAFVTMMRSKLPIIWVPVDSSMWYFPAPQLLVPTKNKLAHFLLNESLYYYLMLDAQARTHKDRYEYYDLGLRMWSTPAFVLAVHDQAASDMFDLEPARVEFDDDGLIKSVHFGPEGANMQVVRSVNGTKLNEFMVARINR